MIGRKLLVVFVGMVILLVGGLLLAGPAKAVPMKTPTVYFGANGGVVIWGVTTPVNTSGELSSNYSATAFVNFNAVNESAAVAGNRATSTAIARKGEADKRLLFTRHVAGWFTCFYVVREADSVIYYTHEQLNSSTLDGKCWNSGFHVIFAGYSDSATFPFMWFYLDMSPETATGTAQLATDTNSNRFIDAPLFSSIAGRASVSGAPSHRQPSSVNVLLS